MGATLVPDRAFTVLAFALAGIALGTLSGLVPGLHANNMALLFAASAHAIPGPPLYVGVTMVAAGVAHTFLDVVPALALGSPRTGVLVAVEQANVPLNLPVLLSGVALAAVAGFVLVLLLGDAYLAAIGRANHAALSIGVLALLVAVSWLFAGGIGVGAFGAAALVESLPPRFGTRRAHLMGC